MFNVFVGQRGKQFVVARFQGIAHFADQFAKIATRNLDPDNITDKLANGGKRGVANAFHIGHQRGEPGPEKLAFLDFRRQRGIMKLLATWAPIGPTAMLFDANRHVDDFDLLHHAGCTVGVFESAAAQRARLQRVFPSRRRSTRAESLDRSCLGCPF